MRKRLRKKLAKKHEAKANPLWVKLHAKLNKIHEFTSYLSRQLRTRDSVSVRVAPTLSTTINIAQDISPRIASHLNHYRTHIESKHAEEISKLKIDMLKSFSPNTYAALSSISLTSKFSLDEVFLMWNHRQNVEATKKLVEYFSLSGFSVTDDNCSLAVRFLRNCQVEGF